MSKTEMLSPDLAAAKIYIEILILEKLALKQDLTETRKQLGESNNLLAVYRLQSKIDKG